MIKGNEKLIIICGMAHSGTTIVAHVIRQHPDFVLFNNGSMAFILENDFLLNANAQKIESLTQKENRVILKRPWIENNHTDWLIENMPNSYYLYCLKDKNSIIKSWSAHNSYVNPKFRKSSHDEKSNSYDTCYSNAMKLKDKVKNFMTIENEKLIANPIEMFNEINIFLNAKQFNYNLSDVSSTKSIKTKLIEERKKPNIKTQNNRYKML
jgi:hypothetical protein